MSDKKFLLITIPIIICGLLVLDNKQNNNVCYEKVNYCYDLPKPKNSIVIKSIKEIRQENMIKFPKTNII